MTSLRIGIDFAFYGGFAKANCLDELSNEEAAANTVSQTVNYKFKWQIFHNFHFRPKTVSLSQRYSLQFNDDVECFEIDAICMHRWPIDDDLAIVAVHFI